MGILRNKVIYFSYGRYSLEQCFPTFSLKMAPFQPYFLPVALDPTNWPPTLMCIIPPICMIFPMWPSLNILVEHKGIYGLG